MAMPGSRLLTNLGTWLSRPWAIGAVFLYALLWIFFVPGEFRWHGVATTVTLLMTLFIQRSEHRDTQAIHVKLAELLRVHGRQTSAHEPGSERARTGGKVPYRGAEADLASHRGDFLSAKRSRN